MKGRTASILLAGLLFPGLSMAQTPSVQRLISAKNEENKRGSNSSEQDAGFLSRTIDRVERAFESGDPDELEPCLSEKKIYLSLKAPGAEAGYYGRSQVKFMLKKLFQERKTDSFTYDPQEIEVSGGESAAFRAQWSYVPLEAEDVVTEHLRFKLDRDKGAKGNDWLVSEIRSR